jgi:hypothetical protein
MLMNENAHTSVMQSEALGNQLWSAILATSLCESGAPTLCTMLKALEKNEETKNFAQMLSNAIDEYKYEVALSTNPQLDCGVKIFDECPNTIASVVAMAVQLHPGLIANEPALKEWQPDEFRFKRLLKANLEAQVQAALEKCGLRYNAAEAVPYSPPSLGKSV